MATERRAPGLRDDWFNGWLAAVGVTVLVDGLRLRWSDDRRSHAIFACDDSTDVAVQIAAALPSMDDLDALLIANGNKQFPRDITLERYGASAMANRGRLSDFSLSSTATDLADVDRQIPHGFFDTSAPQGKTLWDRLMSCLEELRQQEVGLVDQVAASLDGYATRVKANGLGFDVRRIEAGDAPNDGKFVDPVVELLAFYGLALFPVRGDGRREATRGWRRERPPGATGSSGRRGRAVFQWPSWSAPLDHWAIDALLAEVYAPPARPRDRDRRRGVLGVRHVYEAVLFQKTGDMDMTAGLASRVAHG